MNHEIENPYTFFYFYSRESRDMSREFTRLTTQDQYLIPQRFPRLQHVFHSFVSAFIFKALQDGFTLEL